MPAIATLRQVSLREMLAFRHGDVVRRYAEEHHTTLDDAEDIFEAMLQWLYLCHRSTLDGRTGVTVSMTSEVKKIDWMWHTFILFTQDYATFCDRYFGIFLHHVPAAEEAGDTPPDDEWVQENLEKQFRLIYDVLGEKTLIKWYDEFRYAVMN